VAKTFHKCKWVVENAKPYYSPLITPDFVINRYYFWSSDTINTNDFNETIQYTKIRDKIKFMSQLYGFDLSDYKYKMDVKKCLRNCVNPQIGKYIPEQILKQNNKSLY